LRISSANTPEIVGDDVAAADSETIGLLLSIAEFAALAATFSAPPR
jgi:hypothetical protein